MSQSRISTEHFDWQELNSTHECDVALVQETPDSRVCAYLADMEYGSWAESESELRGVMKAEGPAKDVRAASHVRRLRLSEQFHLY